MPAHGLQGMGQLGGVGLQELAPGRRGEEELAHLDGGAGAARRRLQLAAARVQPRRVCGFGHPAGDRQVRDRRDRCQRLTTKTHRRHRLELGQRGDLARRMPTQGQRQLVGRHAGAVVLDHGGPHTAAEQPHDDLPRTGIQRVVEQLAHHRGRTLDDLAGGDLADQLVAQLPDRAAAGGPRPRVRHGIHHGHSRRRRRRRRGAPG
jgi:hypothetical protein